MHDNERIVYVPVGCPQGSWVGIVDAIGLAVIAFWIFVALFMNY